MRTPSARNGRRTRRGTAAPARTRTRAEAAGGDTFDLAELLTVLTAVRKGDFSARMGVNRTGIAGKVADTLNDIIELNQEMARELDRVSIVVGKEGRITQRARLAGAGGAWAASIDSVNGLILDLVQPTSEVSRVIGAVAKGDLSQTMALDFEGRPLMGEFLRIGRTVNSMVDQLSSFASEVTRVAREVGTEGKLGGQARVKGVAGTWKDLTDNVNSMAGNLTAQVRNIAEVTTAVARGELNKKITVDVKGEILELKNTINTMVDQLNSFASEVTRVAREVGTEGKLGGQAQVTRRRRHLEGPDGQRELDGRQPDGAGPQHRRSDNRGGQRRPLQEDHGGREGRDPRAQEHHQHDGGPAQLLRLRSDPRGSRGRYRRQARRPGTGARRRRHLEGPHRQRELDGRQPDRPGPQHRRSDDGRGQRRASTRRSPWTCKGEILELKNTINTMVDQLSSFASEVTRVAREVGTEGKLGGQARVTGVGGTWKDLTDNVNWMAGNLTAQVRNIAEVTTAVANGDLSKKITVDVQGEILELKNTINTMVDQLSSFASEVTRVAREVGTEGKLGGQARVAGVGGTWKDLTDNVNSMAGNLTSQVRNIAEVTTAVARGELNKKITVDVQGRDPRAQEHHQHDGGPAELLRLRGDPRGPRGRHRREAGRPGAGDAASAARGRT